MTKTALVTGCDGFIGRHFSRHLQVNGWNVAGIDIKDGGADCRDYFRHAEPWARFDLIVHAAAIVGGRTKIEGEPLEVASDLAIDADMFGFAARTQARRVLYFSSSAAYPIQYQRTFSGLKLQEDWIDLKYVGEPDQSYGWVKITGEMLAGLARDKGVPVTVVRPFSGYGTDQDLTYPFPSFIDRARRNVRPFEVWGDGRQVRDFVHVDDVLGACFAIMEDGTEEPVNIGTGRATSFDDLAYRVMDAAGRTATDMELAHDLTKPVGVAYRVADTERLHRYYRPTVSLEEGIERALHARKV